MTVLAFLPAFLLQSVWVAAPCFFLAALFLGATNPTLDAARLDIMHSRLWGRAESVRNLVRYTLGGIGAVDDWLAGRSAFRELPERCPCNWACVLILLVLLLLTGVAMIFAAFTYPRDVATVLVSEHGMVATTPDAEDPEPSASRSDSQIKTIGMHDFGPGAGKVLDEFLTGVVLSIDLSNCPQL